MKIMINDKWLIFNDYTQVKTSDKKNINSQLLIINFFFVPLRPQIFKNYE